MLIHDPAHNHSNTGLQVGPTLVKIEDHATARPWSQEEISALGLRADDPRLLLTLTYALSRRGYTVSISSLGREILARVWPA